MSVRTYCPTRGCTAVVTVSTLPSGLEVPFCADCAETTAAFGVAVTPAALGDCLCADCGDTLAWCPPAARLLPELAVLR